METRDKETCELKIVNRDGHKFYARLDIISIEGGKGDVTEFRISMSDIDVQKKAVKALRESEELHRITIENIQDPLFITDSNGKFTFICPNIPRILGYSVAEIEEMGNVSVFMGENQSLFDLEDLNRLGEISNIEAVIANKNGSKRDYLVTVKRVSIKSGTILYICRDITARKKAEEALKESERQLTIKNRIAEIFLTTPDHQMYGKVLQVVLEAMESPYGTFAYINEGGDRIVPSMTRDIWDECKMREKSIVFPRDKWGDSLWARSIIEKKSFSSNGPFKVPDGHMPISRALASPIIYKGETIGNLMVGNKTTDYSEKDKELLERIADRIAPILYSRLLNEKYETERKQSEAALRESEEKYRNILENMEEGYYEVDLEGSFTFVNDAMCRIRGYAKDEMIGMNNRQYMDPETAKKVYKLYSEVYRNGRPIKNCQWKIMRRDETEGYVEVSASLVKDLTGKPIGFQGIVQDVTQKKQDEMEKERLQSQLHQSQKMEAVGTLAGGIAHDFNNILAIIMGNAELAFDDVPNGNPAKDSLNEIRLASVRAKDMVQQLLAFSRKSDEENMPLDMAPIIKESMKMLRSAIPTSVAFEQRISGDPCNVMGDATQINQIVMNLVTNAADAMSEKRWPSRSDP